MGLFKKLKKAFKKVTSGIKKNIKKTLSGLNKIQKKIRKSKLFKALVIAAAVVVTGGAALGAMGATTGAGLFGSAAAAGGTGFAGWMTGTAASLTSTTLGAALATPFTALGTAIGSTALALGVPAISNAGAAATASSSAFAGTAAEQLAVTASPSAVAGSSVGATGTAAQQLAVTVPSTLQVQLRQQCWGFRYSSFNAAIAQGTDALSVSLANTPATVAQTANAATEAASTWATRNPRTAAFLNNKYVQGAAGAAGSLAMSVAGGYAMHKLTEEDPSGNPQGAAYEGSSQFDPLQVYAGYRGIDESDISKYFTFGNTASAGNMPLFQQQTIGVPD
jgi:hypothetical protein